MTCAYSTIGERTFGEVRKINISQQGGCGLASSASLLLMSLQIHEIKQYWTGYLP